MKGQLRNWGLFNISSSLVVFLPLVLAAAPNNGAPTNWHSVTGKDVASAPCRQKVDLPTVQKYFHTKSISVKTRKDQVINGVAFVSEDPQLLELFSKLTTFKSGARANIFAKPAKDQINFQDAYKINPQCQKVLCAVEKIYGASVGLKILYALDRFGLNGSHFLYNKSIPWEDEEFDDILGAASSVESANFLPVSVDKQLSRYKHENYSSIANMTFYFFDGWGELDSYERQYSAIHEFSHELTVAIGLGESSQWLKASGGWHKEKHMSDDGTEYLATVPDSPEKIVSEYGLANIKEAMAEAAAAYRYNPKLLKARNMEVYELLREVVFDGVEYNSEAQCQNAKPISKQLERFVEQRPLETFEEVIQSNWVKACGSEILKNFEGDGESFRSCLRGNLSLEVYQRALFQMGLNNPELFAKSLAWRRLAPLDYSSTLKQIEDQHFIFLEQKISNAYLVYAKQLADRIKDKVSKDVYCADISQAALQFLKDDVKNVFSTDVLEFGFKQGPKFKLILSQVCSTVYDGDPKKIPTTQKVEDAVRSLVTR